MFKLYKNEKSHCVVVSEVDDKFVVIPGKRARLDVEMVDKSTFLEIWQPLEYDERKAAETFAGFAKEYGASDRANAYIQEALLESSSATPETIEAIFAVDDGSVVDEPGAEDAAPNLLSEAPVSASQEVEPAAVEQTVVSSTQQGNHEMNQPSASNVAPATLPIGAPVSVSMTKAGLSVSFGDPEAGKFSPAMFNEKPCSVAAEKPELSFYVAIDDQGSMARCVTECNLDRKNVASIVGNWLAEGYSVERRDAKGVAKLLRMHQASKQAAAPQDPDAG